MEGAALLFWMQDKPLLQEELSEKLCGLLKAFPDGPSALAFASAFFTTQANEWGRLDQWRMDKFMMLIRDFLHATFEVLKQHKWEGTLAAAVSTLVGKVMDPQQEAYPDGLRLHLADMYLEELEKVGSEELDGNTINVLLEPFIKYIAQSNRDTIVERITKSVFGTILNTTSAGRQETEQHGEKVPKLKYNCSGIQQMLFAAGRKKDLKPRVRKRIYKLVKRFSGVERTETRENVQKKRKLQAPEEEEEPKKKKKRISRSTLTDTAQSDSPSECHTQPQTYAEEENKAGNKMVTPSSAPKHVAFDLQRNSSRGLQEFVMSAARASSLYLPTRSPTHGILKDSPGPGGSTPTSRLASGGSGDLAEVDTPTGATSHKTGKLFKKRTSSSDPQPASFKTKKVTQKNTKGKSQKPSKFVCKKKGRVLRKPKHR